jgi:hypothetical protein
VTFTVTLSSQTVSWSPVTALGTAESPKTPSALASTSGNGAITYSVTSAGDTGCTVNSTTAVLTVASAGSCVVRATAAATSAYSTSYAAATFTVTLSSQTVSWSPDTALVTGQSSATPSILASTSGNGAITYSTSSQNCTVNSVTAVLTYPVIGKCVVRATAAATSSFLTGFVDVTFTVRGPGGGLVFYYSATAFSSIGSDCVDICHYLEAAPSDQSSGINWATSASSCYEKNSTKNNVTCRENSVYSGTETEQISSRNASAAIGMGMSNTDQIYARVTTASGIANSADYAAGIAWAYSNNGKDDWFLPSRLEANQMCRYAWSNSLSITNTSCISREDGSIDAAFSAVPYWTSSEGHELTKYQQGYAWYKLFQHGVDGHSDKKNRNAVRPVRAF